MSDSSKDLLLTGPPGCGKTTVIRRVVKGLGDRRLAGFYTEEIRKHGNRTGFRAVGLSDISMVLAHVDFHGPARVGKYGVDVPGFEEMVHREFDKPDGAVNLFVIDEVGKMECSSKVFVETVVRVLGGPAPVLGTIAARGGGFIERVKRRTDVEIIAVSAANRDRLPESIITRLLSRLP